ncbi:MAG: HAD family hydrolase, partial [Aestuariivirgaceae bacterium]
MAFTGTSLAKPMRRFNGERRVDSCRNRRRTLAHLLIFDFDGVIADSEMLANSVLAEVVSELGTPTTLEQSYERYLGKRFAEVIEAVEGHIKQPLPDGFADAFQARTLDRFRADLTAVPGVRDYIKTVADVAKCIASSSSLDRLD